MEVKKVGRPDKFTPERRKAILESIASRVPYEIAAEANGICEDTLYDWIKHGRYDQKEGIESEYAKFSEAIKQIEAIKITHHLNTIESKPERWQADAWILERRWWQHFSPNAAVINFHKRMKKLEEEEKGTLNESEIKELHSESY